VIDAPYDSAAITAAMQRCLFDDAFRAACRSVENPYGVGHAGRKIAHVLSEVPLDAVLLRKGMTLRGETREGWFR
jgi:UDP-N-acetylglucosamine 2-epimerase (non-hydrolysing)/GDP/UDP-N,N'-diacetylbacillosamine 2-epimerase (hydrolysing)